MEDRMTAAVAALAGATETREEWLIRAVAALTPLFAEIDATVPPVRVSVGWPGGRGKKGSVIGQCWPTGLAEDGVAQLFISPVLADASRVLDVLLHELIHAVDNCENGHKAPFARMAKALGLTGKMTATVASDNLAAKLSDVAAELGDYPHAALSKLTVLGKKQGTRMRKVECPVDGYTLRTTAKWLAVGVPTCPCGEQMVAEDVGGE